MIVKRCRLSNPHIDRMQEEEKRNRYRGNITSVMVWDSAENALDGECIYIWKEDNRELGAVTVFFPSEKEAELTAGLFTEDTSKRAEIFDALVIAASEDCKRRGIEDLYLVHNPEYGFVWPEKSRLHPVVHHAEYLMHKYIREAGTEDASERKKAGTKPAKSEKKNGKIIAETINGNISAENTEGILLFTRTEETEKVGHLCILPYRDDAAYLYGLWVEEPWRRKGIARQLMNGTQEYLAKKGYREIKLQVSSLNLPAEKLYDSLGYEITDTREYLSLSVQKTSDELRKEDRKAKENAYARRMEKKQKEEQIREQQRIREEEQQKRTDLMFMKKAYKLAQKAGALGEVPIGCVLVRDGKVIASGYNRRNTDRTTLAHAEIAAIKKASRILGDWRLSECTLYVTLEPCPMCAGAIVQARIPRVVAACMNPKAGCAGSVLNVLQTPGFNHFAEFTNGVMEKECSELLSTFFSGLRAKKAETAGKANNCEPLHERGK